MDISMCCSKRWITLQSLLLIISLFIKSSHAEICDLCADGSPPGDPNAKFTYKKNNQFFTVPCSTGYELALQGEFSNCTSLQLNVKDICACPDIDVDDRPCNLCLNGQALPLPSRIVAGQTCKEWETAAQNDFEMDCPAWQKSIGRFWKLYHFVTLLLVFLIFFSKVAFHF